MKDKLKPFSLQNPIKIKFRNISGWSGIDSYWIKLLQKYGKPVVRAEKNPDLIFYSVFGPYNLLPFRVSKARLVFFTGENSNPDRFADFNITFDPSESNHNLRMPLWTQQPLDPYFQMRLENKTKFCSFIYSHKIKLRNQLCQAIAKYKTVDCGGDCLNNLGYKVKEKATFQKQYKFDIACENSSSKGYVTEKIINAYHSHCIPIYWGAEEIEKDFNPETFINAKNFSSFNELVRYIAAVDQDKKLYESYFNKPIFSQKWQKAFSDGGDKFYKEVCDKICPPSSFPLEKS